MVLRVVVQRGAAPELHRQVQHVAIQAASAFWILRLEEHTADAGDAPGGLGLAEWWGPAMIGAPRHSITIARTVIAVLLGQGCRVRGF